MAQYTYFVVTRKHIASGHIRSEAEKINNCQNLLRAFKPWVGCTLLSVNACDTWKEAQRIADEWNTTVERNGELYRFWEEG